MWRSGGLSTFMHSLHNMYKAPPACPPRDSWFLRGALSGRDSRDIMDEQGSLGLQGALRAQRSAQPAGGW